MAVTARRPFCRDALSAAARPARTTVPHADQAALGCSDGVGNRSAARGCFLVHESARNASAVLGIIDARIIDARIIDARTFDTRTFDTRIVDTALRLSALDIIPSHCFSGFRAADKFAARCGVRN